jgi:hypothetical protein
MSRLLKYMPPGIRTLLGDPIRFPWYSRLVQIPITYFFDHSFSKSMSAHLCVFAVGDFVLFPYKWESGLRFRVEGKDIGQKNTFLIFFLKPLR